MWSCAWLYPHLRLSWCMLGLLNAGSPFASCFQSSDFRWGLIYISASPSKASINQNKKQKCCWPDFGWYYLQGTRLFHYIFNRCCVSEGILLCFMYITGSWVQLTLWSFSKGFLDHKVEKNMTFFNPTCNNWIFSHVYWLISYLAWGAALNLQSVWNKWPVQNGRSLGTTGRQFSWGFRNWYTKACQFVLHIDLKFVRIMSMS